MKWYRLSADQAHPIAQYRLGEMYYNGDGVPQDYKKALKWFRLAADQGDSDAQGIIGQMYAHGLGVPRDKVRAYAWINIAIEGNQYFTELKQELQASMTAAQLNDAQNFSSEIFHRIESEKCNQ